MEKISIYIFILLKLKYKIKLTILQQFYCNYCHSFIYF